MNAAPPIIHLLLLEDNPGDVRLIREMLLRDSRQRVNLDHTDFLQIGLQRLQERTYDAILLDLTLPDSHGMDTLLKVGVVAPDTAIVVLTGNDDEDLGLQAVQMGAQDYLPKSEVDGKLLMRSLRYAIERHRIELMIRQSEQEYRSLIDDVFNTSMVAVLILNQEYRVVWCNEATQIYFGIPRERLIGKDSRLLVDGELKCIFADPDDYAARLLNAYEYGEFTDRFECHVLPEMEREERWLEHWSQPIREGMYAGGRIEQYTDITDRKMLEIAEEEHIKFAEALQDISALLTSTLDLDEVLGRILNNLGRIVPHDSATIIMLEEDHLWVAQHRHGPRRDTQELVAEKQMQVEYRAYLETMLTTGKPVIEPDLQTNSQVKVAAEHANLHGYIGAPVRLQNKIAGFMNVFSEQVGFFTEMHSERLTAFAELAAIAIQNARLFRQSQALAVVEERQRLARDLHDSVSQTLFTCRTMAESALRRWDKDPRRAHELITEVYQLTATALAEMRILLLELRPAVLTQVRLKQLFEQYLKPIQDRGQFKLSLAIDDIPALPPDVQIALYRIVQEALNNIDKHARATQVIVSAKDYDDRVELQISDDGEGFDLEMVRETSLGLGIIKERAERIGASLHIDSRVGEGTRIIVIWQKQ
jgi:signal transduction histidine kinase/DNA-binding NarL/FixJ family response regulator